MPALNNGSSGCYKETFFSFSCCYTEKAVLATMIKMFSCCHTVKAALTTMIKRLFCCYSEKAALETMSKGHMLADVVDLVHLWRHHVLGPDVLAVVVVLHEVIPLFGVAALADDQDLTSVAFTLDHCLEQWVLHRLLVRQEVDPLL